MLHHISRGSGRPVLVLHGATLDHRHMMETIEPVFEGVSGWRRIYVDLPGHGKSPPSDDIQTMNDVLDAVITFAEAVAPGEKLLLIGESRGSHIAQGFAHVRPDLVDGMLLIVPGGAPSTPKDRFPTQITLRPDRELRKTIPEERLPRYDWLVVQTPEIVEKTRRTKWAVTGLHDPDMAARVLANFDFPFDIMTPDSPITGPCLIVAGRQDGVSGFADAMDFMSVYPRASLAVLDTGGHAVAWERPGAFKALALDWLERVMFELSL